MPRSYIQSGLPRGTSKDDISASAHAGHIISEFRAKCKCGYYGPIREFHCDASQDLWNHFEKKGTLLPIPDFGGWINGRRDAF